MAAYAYNRAHSPSSDLTPSIVDMARWAEANLNRGELDGHRILKSSTYEVMWKPAIDVEFKSQSRTSETALATAVKLNPSAVTPER